MTFNKVQGRCLKGFSVASMSLTYKESLMSVALLGSEKMVKQQPKASFIGQKLTLNESRGLRLLPLGYVVVTLKKNFNPVALSVSEERLEHYRKTLFFYKK